MEFAEHGGGIRSVCFVRKAAVIFLMSESVPLSWASRAPCCSGLSCCLIRVEAVPRSSAIPRILNISESVAAASSWALMRCRRPLGFASSSSRASLSPSWPTTALSPLGGRPSTRALSGSLFCDRPRWTMVSVPVPPRGGASARTWQSLRSSTVLSTLPSTTMQSSLPGGVAGGWQGFEVDLPDGADGHAAAGDFRAAVELGQGHVVGESEADGLVGVAPGAGAGYEEQDADEQYADRGDGSSEQKIIGFTSHRVLHPFVSEFVLHGCSLSLPWFSRLRIR